MTNFTKKLFAKFASVSLALTLSTPVFAATNLQVTGNGAFSSNDVEVELQHEATVVQSNEANVTNNVSSTASTGGNDANFNTGGDVTVWTGDASTDVEVSNLLNKNVASVDCCELGDIDVLISGNGAYADSSADVDTSNNTTLFQDNDADVHNYVEAESETGNNDTKFNTGGDTVVKTGNAETNVDIATAANANVANVGGGTGGHGGELSLRIIGNGAYSDSDIEVDLEHFTTLVQSNRAWVDNYVDADANTGYNDSDYGTGGDIAILTGHATTDVTVANWLNFNAADVDCFCLFDDLLAKADGNGAYSDNQLTTSLNDALDVFQDGNKAWVSNEVEGESETGYNGLDFNTGDSGADPFVRTGNSDSSVDVSNASNLNVFGSAGWEWPSLELGWDWNWLEM